MMEMFKAFKLGDLLKKIEGGGTPSKDNPKFWNGNIPWAAVKDFKGCIIETTIDSITEEGLKNSSAKLIPAGTLIIPTRMALGKAAFFKMNVAINQDLKALYPKEKLDKFFLFQWFQLNADKILSLGSGSTVKGIRLEVLRQLEISLPPLPEQQKIADILSTVDAKIDLIDQQITETQELKKGLMQRLLTKGIGHTEFKDSPLGKIPKSWDVVTVKEITKEHKQGYYTKDGYVNNGIRLARITDLNNPKVDFNEMPMLNISDSDFENYKIEKGDFLFARSGAIGRYGIVENEEYPAVFASYLIRFRFNPDIINRFFGYFFESFLCSNQLKGITQGNANININAENIKSLKFPLAPFEEQSEIASIISIVDDKIEILTEKKETQKELKKGLMQQLLTGKIRVKV